MVRYTEKGRRFEALISRADVSLDNNYCIEASTIYYAILEERFISIMSKLGYTLNKKQKMHYCINELKKLAQTNDLVRDTFEESLLNSIDMWRDKRNDIIHDFAKLEIPYNEIEDWAKEGKILLRKFNAAVMRFKKGS